MAYDAAIDSVSKGTDKLFFLNGPAGTGKIFVYNAIAATLCSRGDIVIMVASSGIASLLLVGGRTSHSTFKIPFEVLDDSMCGFSKESPQAELFRRTKLIIWDDVPIQHKFCVEGVDRTLKDTCKNNRFFGVITVVFGGDFRHCLPVILKGVREQIVDATLRRPYLWDHVNVLTLVQYMRLENGNLENIEFANTLNKDGARTKWACWTHTKHVIVCWGAAVAIATVVVVVAIVVVAAVIVAAVERTSIDT